MTKDMYLSAVRVRIKKLPDEEIQNAMEYLEEYFAEAGEGNEEEVIKELGSPEKMANQIKADYTVRRINEPKVKGKRRDSLKDTMMILLGILSLPISIPLAIVIIALAFSLFMVILSVIIVLIAIVFAILVSGIIMLGVGIAVAATSVSSAIYMVGCALMILAVGIIVSVVFDMLIKHGIPALTRGIGNLYHKVKGDEQYE